MSTGGIPGSARPACQLQSFLAAAQHTCRDAHGAESSQACASRAVLRCLLASFNSVRSGCGRKR